MADTVIGRAVALAEQDGNRLAHTHRQGGRWLSVTRARMLDEVCDLAGGFLDLGLEPGQPVAILAETCPEWLYADLAAQAAGGVSVGVYPTMTADQAAYVVGHSEAAIAVVENRAQLEKLLSQRSRLACLRHFVLLDQESPAAGSTRDGAARGDGRAVATDASADGVAGAAADALAFAQLCDRGRARRREVMERVSRLRPEQPATYIYTSGTTGPPKGAVLRHGNIAAALRSYEVLPLDERDFGMSFLPLAHALQRVVDYLGIWRGLAGAFAESLAKLPENIAETRPTIMASVPRVFEKIYMRVQAQAQAGSWLRRRIFEWALGVGQEVSRRRLAGRAVGIRLAAEHRLADALVFAKLRARLGGRMRLFASGGAPIPLPVLEFFDAAGIRILEGWALTETVAAATINLPGATRLGTVGRPLPGIQVKLDADGEMLIRGDNVFSGYLKDEAATRAAFTEDGFFRSGDVGRVDADGYFTIIDRKKEIVITSHGKNIPPQNIENLLRREPLIGQAMVVGDRRPYLVALLTLNPDEAHRFAAAGTAVASPAELAGDPRVRAAIGEAVARVNRQLAAYETVKRFAVLPQEFSIENRELTPTLKLCRRVICEHHAQVIDELYGGTA